MTKETVHIPVEKMLEVNRTLLLREWWHTYYLVLDTSDRRMEGLNPLTAELEKRGIVKLGQAMPRDGAEDLAHDCDRIRGWMK